MSETVLKIEHVNRFYENEEHSVEALQDINLKMKRGEFVSIIGASGCGKTSLLRLVAGLDKTNRGTILFNGEPVKEPYYKRGYIFQQHNLFQWLNVEKNVAAGLKARHVFQKNKDKIQKYIDLVGVNGFEKAYPHQLSGGMSQRVAIARALINEPELLLLDEPMGALDSFTRADIQDKLLEIRKEKNLTMLLVTHDVDEAIYMSDRIVIMTPRPGKISQIIEVKMPYPRNRGSVDFLQLRRTLLDKFDLANTQPEPEYVI